MWYVFLKGFRLAKDLKFLKHSENAYLINLRILYQNENLQTDQKLLSCLNVILKENHILKDKKFFRKKAVTLAFAAKTMRRANQSKIIPVARELIVESHLGPWIELDKGVCQSTMEMIAAVRSNGDALRELMNY